MIESTWIKITRDGAYLCAGGTHQYLEKVPVSSSGDVLRIDVANLKAITDRTHVPTPKTITFELGSGSPVPYTVQPGDFSAGGGGRQPNAKGEWLSLTPHQFDYQDTEYTCQSSAIQVVTNGKAREMAVRAELERHGNPGNPYVMGRVIKRHVGARYKFIEQASIQDMIDAIKDGAVLIIQACVTHSGHVFVLNGYDKVADQLQKEFRNDSLLHEGFKVIDHWTKYNWMKRRYDGQSLGYEGYYPAFGIWASTVPSWSFYDFESAWLGPVPNNWHAQKGADLHIVYPE
jgi:hypothetical protein